MITPLIVNHLWQSSCFALAAGLLALALRKNSPRVRYWVWLSASLKFLLPFTLLVGLGSIVPHPVSHTIVPVFPNTLIQIAQPFSPALNPIVPTHAPLPWTRILIVLWALGFLAIALARHRGWLRVRALLQTGKPIQLPTSIPALITPGTEEPGIVGFLHPVLLLPAQLLQHLNPRQLSAILTHELCHVRRRDNLFAAVHMVVEAIFWFNPLVWWIGSRMVEERELACDEEVLRMGCEPSDYVEGILRVCRFYKQSPIPCVSGVTGADVTKRLRTILSGRIARELTAGKKVILAATGLAVLLAPIAIGVLTAPAIRAQSEPRPKFEVASIKIFKDDGGPRNSAVYGPQGITFGGLTLGFMIGEAYQFPVGRIQGPGSLTKEELWAPLRAGYDIVAKANHPVPKDQLRLMLQSLLEERFKLVLHREAKTGLVYKLVIARNGPRLDRAQDAGPFSFSNDPGGYSFRNADMIRLSAFLSGNVDRPVVDQTGLSELYNFILKRPDDVPQDKSRLKAEGGISTDSPSAAAFGGGLKQLGLQLNADRGPVEYLVIDSVGKPSEN